MPGHAIAVDAFSYFCVEQIDLATSSGTTHARLSVHNDVLLLYETILHFFQV